MSIKIFSLFLFACSASILGMEKETLKKDPLLLCELPKELLGNIVRRATHDETFKSIKYLIRISRTCKSLEYLYDAKMIKTLLDLSQDRLNSALITHTIQKKTSIFYATLLISMGADVNTYYNTPEWTCLDTQSCLNLSISFSKTDTLAELLIAHGAHIYFSNKSGDTPLHIATERNKLSIVKKLLDHKADMYVKNKYNQSPIDIALYHEQLEVIKLFIEYDTGSINEYKYTLNEHTLNGFRSHTLTVAEWAQLKNHQEICDLIIEKKKPKDQSIFHELTKDCVIS